MYISAIVHTVLNFILSQPFPFEDLDPRHPTSQDAPQRCVLVGKGFGQKLWKRLEKPAERFEKAANLSKWIRRLNPNYSYPNEFAQQTVLYSAPLTFRLFVGIEWVMPSGHSQLNVLYVIREARVYDSSKLLQLTSVVMTHDC